MAATTGVKQVVGSVVLAVLSQPIHELGHAIALRALTGFWPRISALSVQPFVPINTKPTALVVLAAGDFAVLAWWALIFVWMQGRQRDWAIVGTTFVLLVVLLEWLTAAAMFPFGRSNLGGSDAAKFLQITGLQPWSAAALVCCAVLSVFVGITLLMRGYARDLAILRNPGATPASAG
jgi:hypothetical protein